MTNDDKSSQCIGIWIVSAGKSSANANELLNEWMTEWVQKKQKKMGALKLEL